MAMVHCNIPIHPNASVVGRSILLTVIAVNERYFEPFNMTIKSKLFPVRIDVSSDDKNIRIVDTLLIDPTCWPIPLYSPLQESVERNIRDYAYTVLSDAEVTGMGRTVRHFTGRVDLWSTELQTKIEDQLRPQIWAIVNDATNTLVSTGKLIPITIRLVIHGISIHEDIQWDQSVPVTPMEFAQEFAKDLNLPEDAVVAVLICILEQLHGLPMDTSTDESASSQTAQNRGAWLLDPKDTVATTNQIVASHKPE